MFNSNTVNINSPQHSKCGGSKFPERSCNYFLCFEKFSSLTGKFQEILSLDSLGFCDLSRKRHTQEFDF